MVKTSTKNRRVVKIHKHGKHPNSIANLKHTGRPKGTKNHDGLQVVLNMLKDFIEEKNNLEKLKKDFQKKFNSNPSGFYYKMIMPLLPKNVDITSGGEDLIRMLSEKYMPNKTKRK